MPKCAVKQCRNNTLTTLKKNGVSYFRFPQNEFEREKWRRIIAKERGEEYFKANDSSVVCSCHFAESDMYYTKKGYRKVRKGVFPRIEETVSENNTESLALQEHITDPNETNRCTPSPTFSDLITILDSPKTSHYKKTLKKNELSIDLKNKQIQSLKKKNKRLLKRNLDLKALVVDLQKQVKNLQKK